MGAETASLLDGDLAVGDLEQGALRAPQVPYRLDLARLHRAAAGLDLLGFGFGWGLGWDMRGSGERPSQTSP